MSACPLCKGEGWIGHYSGGEPDPYPCQCNPSAEVMDRSEAAWS
jgi:hypothetical protein